MGNALSDLNNILFSQVQRLANGENLNPEDMKKEIEKAKAIEGLSKQIISNAKLQLDAVKFSNTSRMAARQMPDVLQNKNANKLIKNKNQKILVVDMETGKQCEFKNVHESSQATGVPVAKILFCIESGKEYQGYAFDEVC